jgi:protein arginine kinase
LFQISNQTTLGEREDEILERLQKVILQVIEHEQNARKNLLQNRPNTLLDHIGRSYGILRHAYSMNSKEALNLLSLAKLGCDLGFYPDPQRRAVDELFMETQPAHLQKGSQKKLATEERDILRSDIIRKKLETFSAPDVDGVMRRGKERSGAPSDPDPDTASGTGGQAPLSE